MSCDQEVSRINGKWILLEGLNSLEENLRREALTHVSYANERGRDIKPNERLEFLGDAVISLVTALYLVEKYKDADEGQLTRMRASLVSGQTLCEVALESSLGDFILLGRGEERTGGRKRQKILAGAFEAIIGAYFLQYGWEKTRELVEGTLLRNAGEISAQDAKSRVQELVQKHFKEPIEYKVLEVEGPDHMPTYTVGLFIGSKKVSEGKGSSKKEAEEKAAGAALEGGLRSMFPS